MKLKDDIIGAVRINFSGSGYSYELCNDTETSLQKESLLAICRGTKGPASGFSLIVEVFVSYVVPAMAAWAVEKVLDCIAESATKSKQMGNGEPPFITRVTVQLGDYNIVVVDRSFTQEFDESSPDVSLTTQLLKRIDQLVAQERAAGDIIRDVVLPCKCYQVDGELHCALGYGTTDFWFVEYSEGAHCSFSAVYDSVNEQFIDALVDD